MAAATARHAWLLLALLATSCGPAPEPAPTSQPAAAPGPVAVEPAARQPAIEPAAPTTVPTTEPAPVLALAVNESVPAEPPAALPAKVDVYSGVHALGVNRVTDMARTGIATFTRSGDTLRLEGRVQRGRHWLALRGAVTAEGPSTFHLDGVLEGVPDMAWAGESPRERRTEGRFTFEIRKGRPYWRLYRVNGKDCVCDDRCGNDFCYVDIEQRPGR